MAAHLDPVGRRRRITLIGLALVTVLVLAGAYVAEDAEVAEDRVATAADARTPSTGVLDGEEETTATEAPTTTTTRPPVIAATTVMQSINRITGDISPKSVVASPAGHVFAQNMMYTHTVTAYAPDGTLTATIDDSVDLRALGVPDHPGVSRGAPVEAAFTSDGRHAYVSNYSMYGAGFGPEGADSCAPDSGYDDSFTYRVDTETMAIDQVIQVGAVPEYVAVTPDDRKVLVTNWCTYDLSIIDVASGREEARVPIGPYPRGIVVSPDSRTAYVAVMGAGMIVRVDLTINQVSTLVRSGGSPRHLLISPDGRSLYVSHNGDSTVASVDAATGAITHRVTTGQQPRSMAISTDGSAIYVANYESSTVTKLRADDLGKLDEVGTDHHPIGITYEPTTGSVWVACYGGSILVFSDTTPRPPG
ncbi:MAG: YncE family protein [Acidimicrobiales bacterium]